MSTKVRNITIEDMHREPVAPWIADDLREEIKKLRLEIIRLKRKCGETFTMADLGY